MPMVGYEHLNHNRID